uniref:Hypothetical_protein n=1 Tax=Oryza glaberrima TaxID=4538 RepID=G2XLI7_ORYGL|nr:hypothetical_protein [Oryza glaberrima]
MHGKEKASTKLALWTGSGWKTRRSGMDLISQNSSGTQPISRIVVDNETDINNDGESKGDCKIELQAKHQPACRRSRLIALQAANNVRANLEATQKQATTKEIFSSTFHRGPPEQGSSTPSFARGIEKVPPQLMASSTALLQVNSYIVSHVMDGEPRRYN